MRKLLTIGLVIFLVVTIFSCRRPYKKEHIEEIKPNETAFLVPLEGKTKEAQAKFNSIDFLESSKVPAKRVTIPQRFYQTGRKHYKGKWIDTMLLIKVDRSPVTREWTDSTDTGTETKKQAIWVESKDSIEFSIGIIATAMIEETDTAKFLYFYSGKNLSEIMDNNIRGFVVNFLTNYFAMDNLEIVRTKKAEIAEKLKIETIKQFKNFGVTITNIGFSGGLVYRDKEIQEAINKKFSAEMDRKTQEEINQKKIEQAEAEKIAAFQFAQAADARKKQNQVEIDYMLAKAKLEWAKKWDGKLPTQMMPENSNMLINIK
jgi:hypothetical protein